jgi:outer membrane lipoprotein-sorting protein
LPLVYIFGRRWAPDGARWLGLRSRKAFSRRVLALAAALAVIVSAGCAVKRTTHLPQAAIPPAPAPASTDDLIARLNTQRNSVKTLNATVELEPTAGSVYSGVIKQYHDVRAFILLESPDEIRMIGQAPVVRTTIFDMASDGKQFRVWVPSRNEFIVGSAGAAGTTKNSLENLRPQHILDALLAPKVDPASEIYFMNQERQGNSVFDQLNIVMREEGGQEPARYYLARKVWFDGVSLDITRVEFYAPGGRMTEDVHYTDYREDQGVRYPWHISLSRPSEDYSLGITIQKATFNQPIGAEKFALAKPAGAREIDLGETGSGEGSRGQ